MYVENRDSRGWKTRRKDSVSKGQGVTRQSPLTAARAQRAPEHVEDSGWTGFSHIPQALHHTPRMVVFAHLSSFSYSASPNVCFPGCCICFPPRKDYSSVLSRPCRQHQGQPLAPCWARGSPDPQVMKHRSSPGRFPGKRTGLMWHVPHTPSVPNTLHLVCTYLEKQKNMLERVLDFEPLTSVHLEGRESNLPWNY